VNADGTMAVYTSIRAEKLSGWALWTPTGGYYRSVCAAIDTIYFVVERPGVGFFIEEMDPTVMLDCAFEVSQSTPFSIITGLPYPTAPQVSLMNAAGAYLGDAFVSAGEVALPTGVPAQTDVLVGFNFTPVVEVLPIASKDGAGPADMEWRRISRITTLIDSTLELTCQGTELQTRLNTTDGAGFGNALESNAFMFHGQGYSRRPTVVLTQTQPMPFTILAMTIEVSKG
jgi:hypothetical protein